MDGFLEIVDFDKLPKPWEKHWGNMPEFICNDLGPHSQIIISFKTKEDRKAFSKLLNQPISDKTKSLWYPKEEMDKVEHLRYVDKDNIKEI